MILSYETIFIQFIFMQINFGLQCNGIVLCVTKSSMRHICVGSSIGLCKVKKRQTSLKWGLPYHFMIYDLIFFIYFNSSGRKNLVVLI